MKVYNKININYLWLYFVAILLVIMWAIIPIITILKTENDALISSGIFWFILLFAICYALVTMAISNYLIVKDDCAIVKNFFCPFLKFVFYYKDVDKIEVWSRPGSGVYLKIFRKGLPLRQMPLMIRNKYADELFDFWKSRGIHAEPGDWSTIRGIIHTKKTKAEVRNHEVVSIYGRRIIKVLKFRI